MGKHKKKIALQQNTVFEDDSNRIVATDVSGDSSYRFTPLFWHDCTFPPEMFISVMFNLIHNPNINSTYLFRADILHEESVKDQTVKHTAQHPARILEVSGFTIEKIMVRRLIPRNPLVDKSLDQTCLIYTNDSTQTSDIRSLVMYIPHIDSPADCPYYHPAVKAIAFLHVFTPSTKAGIISTHFLYFPAAEPPTPALERIAYHLLATVHKHGQGTEAGYEKRVVHDTLVPQASLQNTYTRLKSVYAKTLIENWVEVTDPLKHVFEDLCIAAFLIELWKDMYVSEADFPGFVDIGCGNGLLVHILLEEGYEGWGFDGRKRKSWETYSAKTKENLKELVLIPLIAQADQSSEETGSCAISQSLGSVTGPSALPGIHSGSFPRGTFIISNHADELTPWTPILAYLSSCPFVAIPCCSHNLTGARFRAPTPKTTSQSKTSVIKSAYASLNGYVQRIAEDFGYESEVEMLRIPSTRNTAIIGRKRRPGMEDINVEALVDRLGGTNGWEVNAMKLVKGAERGH